MPLSWSRAIYVARIAGLLLALAPLAEAAPGDYIKLSAGGLMTAGLQVYIDLETGTATKRSKPRTDQSGNPSTWRETVRQLSPAELQTLKATIRIALRDGLRSKACNEQDQEAKSHGQPPPRRLFTADAISSLEVRLDGQAGYSPEMGCQSPAFNAMWNAAYYAASANATTEK